MPSEHDERRWIVMGQPATGGWAVNEPGRPEGYVPVVPEARALAAEQRVRELEEDMEAAVSARNAGDYKEGYAAGHATGLQRVAELERELRQVGDVSDGYRLALGEDEALLAKARAALTDIQGAAHSGSAEYIRLRSAAVLAEITTASKETR